MKPLRHSKPLCLNVTGSFDPRTMIIEVLYQGEGPATDRRVHRTLKHEVDHLVNLCTSWLGLSYLESWGAALRLVEESFSGVNEVRMTEIYCGCLQLARRMQYLSIDDEYYLEAWNGSLTPSSFSISSSVGRLFATDGTSSGDWFWCLRLNEVTPSGREASIRLPIGLRTILEHQTVGTDLRWMLDHREDSAELFEESLRILGSPAYAHYSGLAHQLQRQLSDEKQSEGGIHRPLQAGLASATMAAIPWDDDDVRASLASYSKTMSFAWNQWFDQSWHFSLAFPAVAAAVLRVYDPSADSDSTPDMWAKLLGEIGLPSVERLGQSRDVALSRTKASLAGSQIGKELSKVVAYVYEGYANNSLASHGPVSLWASFEAGESWQRDASAAPVPIVVNSYPDGRDVWGEQVLSYEAGRTLGAYSRRFDEILRLSWTSHLCDVPQVGH